MAKPSCGEHLGLLVAAGPMWRSAKVSVGLSAVDVGRRASGLLWVADVSGSTSPAVVEPESFARSRLSPSVRPRRSACLLSSVASPVRSCWPERFRGGLLLRRLLRRTLPHGFDGSGDSTGGAPRWGDPSTGPDSCRRLGHDGGAPLPPGALPDLRASPDQHRPHDDPGAAIERHGCSTETCGPNGASTARSPIGPSPSRASPDPTRRPVGACRTWASRPSPAGPPTRVPINST